jgi:hypothetical protein
MIVPEIPKKNGHSHKNYQPCYSTSSGSADILAVKCLINMLDYTMRKHQPYCELAIIEVEVGAIEDGELVMVGD